MPVLPKHTQTTRPVIGNSNIADGTTRILTTYVDPHWRRQYLGSELIDHLTNLLRERGAKSVQATLESHDDRGIGFFNQSRLAAARARLQSIAAAATRPGWRAMIRAWFKRPQGNRID